MIKANIDLDIIVTNARRIAQRVRPARVMAVVKANAYGHGAVRVARALKEGGISFFAVATVDEALELRDAGIDDPILVMTPLMPDLIQTYIDRQIDATVGSEAGFEAALKSDAQGRLRVHLKIDTGMGRIGLLPDRTSDAIAALRASRTVDLVGIATHLSSADEDDLTQTITQVDRFSETLAQADTTGLILHLANTEAVARVESAYRLHDRMMVRTGIGLYGYPIRGSTRETLGLEPSMTLVTEVTNVKSVGAGVPISYNGRWVSDKPTTIVTAGIGYADGYRRSLFGVAEVGIWGRRYPVVGTICMDSIMVDVGSDPDSIAVGDPVVLFGKGGPELVEVAAWASTIPYEIICGVGRRVQRVYRQQNE